MTDSRPTITALHRLTIGLGTSAAKAKDRA